MSRKKAVLILDPDRRAEQLAYVSERAQVLYPLGNHLWAAITDNQAPRFAEQGIHVQIDEDADEVVLPAVVFDPAEGEPQPPESLRAPEPSGEETAYYLVAFIGPPQTEMILRIQDIGGVYVQNLPIHVGLFHLTAQQAAAVRALDFVRWVGIHHPAYALNHVLAGNPDPFTAVTLSSLAIASDALPPPDNGNAILLFFDDMDIETARTLVTGSGDTTILSETHSGFVLQATSDSLLRLLRLQGVRSLGSFLPPAVGNNRAGGITGVNEVRDFRNTDFLINLDGAGEIAGVVDSGLDTGVVATVHADLTGRVLQINHLTAPGTAVPDTAPHGTHVTGTIAGNGNRSGGRIRGVAPACQIVFHGLFTGMAAQGMINAHDAGARVHNNSWGGVLAGPLNPPTTNPYTIGTTDILDRLCYLYGESLMVFISHNQESDRPPPPPPPAVVGDGILDASRLTPESTAKNVLTVGASENLRKDDGYNGSYATFGFAGVFNTVPPLSTMATIAAPGFNISDSAEDIALFSNRGRVVLAPAGRIKPDIVAPGTNIISLQSSATGPARAPTSLVPPATNAFYDIMHGTSMAAPHITGAALLTRQYYRTLFGQLRRPVLLQTVVPGPAPVRDFVDRPALCPHVDGFVFAWAEPEQPANQKRLLAARYSPDLAARTVQRVPFQTNVGNFPMPMLARHGDATLSLRRHSDNDLKLERYLRDLIPDPAFTTASFGIDNAPDLTKRAAMLVVNNDVAVVWGDNSDTLNFRRFNAIDGSSADVVPFLVHHAVQMSPHPYIAHNGTDYGVVCVDRDGANNKLVFASIGDVGGTVRIGTADFLIQAGSIRDPHILWDTRNNRFVVIWCDGRNRTDSEIFLRFYDAAGTAQGGEVMVFSLPAAPNATTLRRPFIALHPDSGYVLLWEDNSHAPAPGLGASFDVYMVFLDDTGARDARIDPGRGPLRLSDTPRNTAGFAALVDAQGILVTWQSDDELNSDRLGVFALRITPQGAFQAQVDPNTPLINSARYVPHLLLEHAALPLTGVSMAWAGGRCGFLLRGAPGTALGQPNRIQLIRTNVDALPDTTFGANGVLDLAAFNLTFLRHELYWAANPGNLIAAMVPKTKDPRVHLFDGEGAPVAGFGANGIVHINEPGGVTPNVTPQVGHITTPTFQIVVVYGVTAPGGVRLRYTVLNGANGAPVTAPLNLANAAGVAPHGWFHFIESTVVGTPSFSIAAWHTRPTPTTADIMVGRFQMNGTLVAAPPDNPLNLTAGLPGESLCAAIAPRPDAGLASLREFAVAWQYRPNAASPWEIRFSRLSRNGQIIATAPLAAAVVTQNVQVIATPAPLNNIEPQLVCTFVHEPPGRPSPLPLPVTTRPIPGYGLAWLEQNGARRTLKFTALDEDGNRAILSRPAGLAAVQAPITTVSDLAASVQDYKLLWNGRIFRLTWTETLQIGANTVVRQRQMALTRHGSPQVFFQPSAPLLRATLINGARNLRGNQLPSLGNHPNDGYGWGRVNLRQSLAPTPPVTFHVRDDNALEQGRTARYRFTLPPDTVLLRTTLSWNDVPGAALVNQLHLRVTLPTGQLCFGNNWQAPPLPPPPPSPPSTAHLSHQFAPAAPAPALQTIHNTEQVVVQNPPPGDYIVEVISSIVTRDSLNQLGVQPYALVFVGSGTETFFTTPTTGVPPPIGFY